MRYLILASLLMLGACSAGDDIAKEIAGCPVKMGERVSYNGKDGTIRAIETAGSWTNNCTVGVKWDDGTTEYIHGWKLDSLETPVQPL